MKMTPEEFLGRLQALYQSKYYDTEAAHGESDTLMEELLISLGYGEGIEFLRKQTRWYA